MAEHICAVFYRENDNWNLLGIYSEKGNQYFESVGLFKPGQYKVWMACSYIPSEIHLFWNMRAATVSHLENSCKYFLFREQYLKHYTRFQNDFECPVGGCWIIQSSPDDSLDNSKFYIPVF